MSDNGSPGLSDILSGDGWLFRSGEDVFGPVPEQTILAKIYSGEFNPGTEISTGDGRWVRLDQSARFKEHLPKAAAQLARKREEEERIRTSKRAAAKRWAVSAAFGLAGVCIIVTAGVAVWKFKAWEYVTGVPPERIELRGATMDEWVDRHPPLVSLGMRKLLNANEKKTEAKKEPAAEPRKKAKKETPKEGASVASADFDKDVDKPQSELTDAEIFSVIKKNIGNLFVCLRDELKRTPDLKGQLEMEFSINNTGKVGDVWIDDARFKEGPLRDCFAEKLTAWKFTPFSGERRVVKYPFFIGKK
jgi:hypothetical protein